MHFSVLVVTAPVARDAVVKEVERLMAPHEEWYDEANETSGGEWDYWRIGGRWAGMFTVHPQAERLVGERAWEWDPKWGSGPWPNDDPLRCDGARKADVDFEAIAVRQIAEAKDRWARRDEPRVWLRKDDTEESLVREASHFLTYAACTENGWEARQRWDGENWNDTPDWHSRLAQIIRAAQPDQWLVVADIHS